MMDTHTGYPGMKVSGKASSWMPCFPADSMSFTTLAVVASLSMYTGAAWTAAALSRNCGISIMQEY